MLYGKARAFIKISSFLGEYNKKVREFRQLGISFLLEVARVLVYVSGGKNIIITFILRG